MNYEIHIQDSENLEDILILEYAERNSIAINWLGGNDTPIVGSECNFTLEVADGADAKFDQYFTSNEQKWLVTKRISETQEIIWQGYLLPESYSEPWENPLFYVEFSAVDGLGLLRGKKLPPDFYREEKTVVEVISECLRLTGINFDIFLAPAITNFNEELWHKIYIDTRKYHDDKLPSAYDILKDVIDSMRCQLFQSEGRWYIEGINKRHLGEVDFYQYDILGEYKGIQAVTKNKKIVHWYPGTVINMMPPFKEVTVTHEAEQLQLPEEIIQESDRDWRAQPGTSSFIYPQYWKYKSDYKPLMKAPDYYLELPGNNEFSVNVDKKISLREKLYILKGWRIRFELEAEILPTDRLYTHEIDAHVDGDWRNVLVYEVTLNNQRIGGNYFTSNEDMWLLFDRDKRAAVHFEYTAEENGYLDIDLMAPWGYTSVNDVEAVRITKLTLEKKDQEKDYLYTKTIEDNSSITKDIDLEIADDVTGLSKCFYLEKQREYKAENYLVPVPILNSYVFNGENYAVVSLEGANLIEQYITNVMYITRGNLLKNLEVIYNFNGGEDMVIKSQEPLKGTLYVKVRDYVEPVIDRSKWLEWSDSIYGVEKKRYGQVVAEVENKLYSVPHLVIEGAAQAPIKFNDIIQFRYKGENKFFIVSDCSWNPDDNESNVTLVEGVYAGTSLGNIPPYVYAGPDIIINSGDTSAQITEAIATDPDGFIKKLQWVKLEGDTGETYSSSSSLNPLISGLIGDNYVFQLTGTDNVGFSASDTMRVIRVNGYEISFIKRENEYIGTEYQVVGFNINVSPPVPEGEQLVITFDASIKLTGVDGLRKINLHVRKQRAGDETYQEVMSIGSGTKYVKEIEYKEQNQTVTIASDTTAWALFSSRWHPMAPASVALYEVKLTSASFQNGNGTVTNLPLAQEYEHVRNDP